MTEGHCLIVPMQHIAQSTGLDEDVFEEIQVFFIYPGIFDVMNSARVLSSNCARKVELLNYCMATFVM